MKSNQNVANAQTLQIKTADISFSPFNYRYGSKPVDEETLQELAASIKTHDVIQPVTVRPLADGKYELVVGERRLRASVIAGKNTIAAFVRELTDEQVKEIQLIENLQRENPHPMAEAIGIMQLLSLGTKKITAEDIAGKLGKSVAYVYQRIKLNNLIDSFREMYFAYAINSAQAVKIARLDHGSQEEFFSNHCKDWQEDGWEIYNFSNRIRNYQLDLKRAPFNIKDAKLDKQAGACTKCPHNTAVTTSLFPEDSTDARCTNRPCYDNKSKLFAILNIACIVKENPGLPIAVPDETALTLYFAGDDKLIKGRTVLVDGVDYRYYEEQPEKPNRDDFNDYEEEEDNEQEFAEAMEEFSEECRRMEDEANAGNYTKAILISENTHGSIIYLHPIRSDSDEVSEQNSVLKTDFKAKDYQEAVKTKTLNAELIGAERQRLEAREARAKELDEIKLQESFYAAMENNEVLFSAAQASGVNDKAVQVFILFDSLNYYWKNQFTNAILPKSGSRNEEYEKLIHFFFHATEQEVSVLARMALLNKSEAKLPNSHAGQMLRLMVKGTPGMDAAALVNQQRTITKEREVKLAEKLAILEVQKKKIA